MKKLTSLKSSSDSNNVDTTKRQNGNVSKKSSQGHNGKGRENNPYPLSGPSNPCANRNGNGHLSFSTQPSGVSGSYSSLGAEASRASSSIGGAHPTTGPGSAAPTISTSPETHFTDEVPPSSKANSSAAMTSNTAGDQTIGGDAGSTFSSVPSVRSMTTTLTTIQSAAPSNVIHGGNNHHNHPNPNIQGSASFTQPFPSSPLPSALPAHLAPVAHGGNPTTYTTATANNLLTDNASILTLASSTKRRRRHSVDTDASVRAMAPASVWGGSRESLPLSVLSGNFDQSFTTPLPSRPAIPAERASVYSAQGVIPALASERNSFYGSRAGGDGASIKSGFLGHSRNDSVGAITTGSPLASPKEAVSGARDGGKVSRRSSAWGEIEAEGGDKEEGEIDDESAKRSDKESDKP
jgi:hypothetical protein